MKKTKRVMRALVVMLLFLPFTLVKAEVTPKFSIVPISKPPLFMPSNGVATALYLIRNNTSLTRTLTMVPIEGIGQLVGGPGACSYPFTLTPGQTCILTLQLIASLMPSGGVHTGPIICKTIGPNDNRPDSFLCSQVSPGSNLEVIVIPEVVRTAISVTPTNLTLSTGVGGSVTVTNLGTTAGALNVAASITSNPNFSVTGSTCLPLLLPGASCTIEFNSTVAGSGTATVAGTNTQPVPINLTAVAPTISVTPTLGIFIAGTGTAFTVTNVSPNPAAVAAGVTANIPLGSNFFIRSNTCPNLLAPGSSCVITLDTTVTSLGIIPIQGSNTNAVNVTLIATAQATLQVSPNPLNFGINGPGSVTVTNTSSTPALNVLATVPAGAITITSQNCPVSLAPGHSCTVTFTSSTVATTTATIVGSNTTTVNLPISAQQATITVTPNPLSLIVANTQAVTVKNTSTSVSANNVAAYPPVGSTISVAQTTCPAALAPLASCSIAFSSTSGSALQATVPIYGTDTNQFSLTVSVSLATIIPSPSSIVLNNTVYVINTSSGAAEQINAIPPSGSNISVTNGCPTSLASGSSCPISLIGTLADLTTTVSVPIQGTNTTATSVSVAQVAINVPATAFTVTTNGGTGSVGVTNTSQTYQANNIVPTFPVGSPLSVGTNTCVPTLGAGSSCTIEFIGGSVPGVVPVTIAGQNTTVASLTVNVVNPSLAALDVSPSSSVIVVDELKPTLLTVRNNAQSKVDVSDLSIKLPSDWAEVEAVVEPGCSNLAPGAACTISLSSKVPYLAKKGIVIQGSNTSIATVDLAFVAGGGLVFDVNDAYFTVASSEDNHANVSLAAKDIFADAIDSNDGETNTHRLLIDDRDSPAAQVCSNYKGGGFKDWYLPAKEELNKIYHHLFALGFGNFTSALYWSSTENDSNTAWLQNFTLAQVLQSTDLKSKPNRVRCVRRVRK